MGAEVNYDLKPENTPWVGEGYHGERINLRVHVLTCQSCSVPGCNSGGTVHNRLFHIFYAVNATKMLICTSPWNKKSGRRRRSH